MAFEIINKGITNRKCLADNVISIGKYGACFGNDATALFSNFTNCEVYLDKENNRVGFKQSNNSITGFKVGMDKNGKSRKSVTGAWAKMLVAGRYVFSFDTDNDMLIIENCLKPLEEEAEQEDGLEFLYKKDENSDDEIIEE